MRITWSTLKKNTSANEVPEQGLFCLGLFCSPSDSGDLMKAENHNITRLVHKTLSCHILVRSKNY